MDTTDYRRIFEGVESTLIRIGNQRCQRRDMQKRLDKYKMVSTTPFTDADYFRKIVHIVFFSGFRAETVERKLPVIDTFLSDYNVVADYGATDIRGMLDHPNMIHHRRKIQACINNARTFRSIVTKNGSFQNFIDAFNPRESFENLMKLRVSVR